ncbi:MAG: thiamine diphosphokinase [Spirochaetia bacterium]|nr:thiamine diphosphokinase [Spirochaetia bacterium]
MNKKGRCVVVSAAEIKNYEKISSYLKPDDYFVVCDGGLNHCKPLGIKPDLIVGDFDSFDKAELPLPAATPPANGDRPLGASWNQGDGSPGSNGDRPPEIIQLPWEKDDTDTFYAVKEALKRGFTQFLLLGVIGQRFDHSLVNISVLLYLKEQGAQATILDDYSEMQLVGAEPVRVSNDCANFSLMCVAGDVSGVTVTGAKWSLDNAQIKTSYQYGISNQVEAREGAVVCVREGVLLLVIVK